MVVSFTGTRGSSARPPPAPEQVRLCATPRFAAGLARTAPEGTYPAAEQPGAGVRGAAPGAGTEPWPSPGAEQGASRGQLRRACGGPVDQGKTLGSK